MGDMAYVEVLDSKGSLMSDPLTVNNSTKDVIVLSPNNDKADHYVANRDDKKQIDIKLGGREVILAIGVFLFLSTSAAMLIVAFRWRSECKVDTCLSHKCIVKAASMIKLLDNKADPCESFYDFSCGNWMKNTNIPKTKSSWSVTKQMEKKMRNLVMNIMDRVFPEAPRYSSIRKAKAFYGSCMNESLNERKGIESFKNVIANNGGWSIDKNWDKDNWQFRKNMYYFYKHFEIKVFFDVWLIKHKNKSMTIQIERSDAGRNFAFNEAKKYDASKYGDKIERYKKFMNDVMTKVNGVGDYEELINSTLKFEEEILKYYPDRTFNETEITERVEISINDLDKLSPFIKWRYFLRTQLTMGINSIVLITEKSFFSNMSKFLQDTDYRIINSYIMWRFVQSQLKYLPYEYRKIEENYIEDTSDKLIQKGREYVCLKSTEQWFGLSIGEKFIKNHFIVESNEKISEMIEKIRESLKETLKLSTWMDSSTKLQAIKKLDGMSYKIGFPKIMSNSSYINDYYSKYDISENVDYFTLNKRCILAQQENMIRHLVNGIKIWEMNPQEVNAFYSPYTNDMIFPAGILQEPMFTHAIPRSINYGSIGATIGHEISHGFDVYGKEYDYKGNKRNWWTLQSRDIYAEKTQCLVDYYSKITVNGFKIDGKLTLGENIADIVGITHAFKAYKKEKKKSLKLPGLDLTSDQLFYLSYGQNWCSKRRNSTMESFIRNNVHSPQNIRVDATLSQVQEFAEAFQCMPGTKMNPIKKCGLF